MNLATATLTAVLALALSAAPNYSMREQKDQSQPVDRVAVTKVTGTIEKVDSDKRVMTLKLDDGRKKTIRVNKSVKDLDKFRPGDRVQMSYTEEVVMMAEPSDEGTAQVAKFGAADVQSDGDNPVLVRVDTSVIQGKIISIDAKKRRLTFEDPNGRKRAVKLSRRIKDKDLETFRPGDSINMAITDEMAVEVVK